MKLIEALNIVRENPPPGARGLDVFLACGCTPLHLETFLAAHLRKLVAGGPVAIHTAVFGDLCGSLERLAISPLDAVVAVVEWSDLDPRLGVRQLGGWGPGKHAEHRRQRRAQP